MYTVVLDNLSTIYNTKKYNTYTYKMLVVVVGAVHPFI